ncbi:hypothetical protein FORC36_1269 [Vibrio vulnificus]|nr:hypothetical protein FORC36_1269 [Vibrio vulnificus]
MRVLSLFIVIQPNALGCILVFTPPHITTSAYWFFAKVSVNFMNKIDFMTVIFFNCLLETIR